MITLENWIRERLDATEEMLDYDVPTDTIRIWIDMYNDCKKQDQIKINAHDLFPSTSIFATTIEGELTDVINIKDCFRFLPQDEKLKVVSVLLEFCAMETNKLINQNK